MAPQGVPIATVRTLIGCALVLAALLGGSMTAHAQGGVDLEQVAVAVGENGYFVDPGSEYLTSDQDLDALRAGLDRTSPVFVAVLPSGAAVDQALSEITRLVGRPATYVVLSGAQWRAGTTVLPPEQVQAAYDDASAAHPQRPDLALPVFLDTFPAPPPPPAAEQNFEADQGGGVPGSSSGAPQVDPALSGDGSSGSGSAPVGPVVLAGLAVVVGAALLLARRRRRSTESAQPDAGHGARHGVQPPTSRHRSR